MHPGILSVIIGLGSQQLIQDILAGLFIVFENVFDIATEHLVITTSTVALKHGSDIIHHVLDSLSCRGGTFGIVNIGGFFIGETLCEVDSHGPVEVARHIVSTTAHVERHQRAVGTIAEVQLGGNSQSGIIREADIESEVVLDVIGTGVGNTAGVATEILLGQISNLDKVTSGKASLGGVVGSSSNGVIADRSLLVLAYQCIINHQVTAVSGAIES